jgi:hypothetical protein
MLRLHSFITCGPTGREILVSLEKGCKSIKKRITVKLVYKGHSWKPGNMSFMYTLKLYALFINGENETALYAKPALTGTSIEQITVNKGQSHFPH